MNSEKNIIYRLNDNISFRKCSLFSGKSSHHGNCTNFNDKEENWQTWYYCNQTGIHFHCTKHPEIELEFIGEDYGLTTFLMCPKCNNKIKIDSFQETIKKCLRMLNWELFKDAELIRLDDWYIPEIKKKEKTTDYWISTEVKTDRDGDTIIVIYVGHKGDSEKTQFFIKPEKLQLSHDYKDLDPSKILSKIVLTLKDRTIKQNYNE